MAKKAQYFADAERLYVEGQHTCSEIAVKLSIHPKTVENWKNEGAWDEKRRAFITEESSFHEDLFRLCRSLMKNIQSDLDNGAKIDPGRMYAFTKLIPNFMRVKEYEDAMAQSKDAGNKTRELTPEVVKMIEREVLGIERKE
jgi:hypothetical protein